MKLSHFNRKSDCPPNSPCPVKTKDSAFQSVHQARSGLQHILLRLFSLCIMAVCLLQAGCVASNTLANKGTTSPPTAYLYGMTPFRTANGNYGPGTIIETSTEDLLATVDGRLSAVIVTNLVETVEWGSLHEHNSKATMKMVISSNAFAALQDIRSNSTDQKWMIEKPERREIPRMKIRDWLYGLNIGEPASDSLVNVLSKPGAVIIASSLLARTNLFRFNLTKRGLASLDASAGRYAAAGLVIDKDRGEALIRNSDGPLYFAYRPYGVPNDFLKYYERNRARAFKIRQMREEQGGLPARHKEATNQMAGLDAKIRKLQQAMQANRAEGTFGGDEFIDVSEILEPGETKEQAKERLGKLQSNAKGQLEKLANRAEQVLIEIDAEEKALNLEREIAKSADRSSD